MSYKAQVPLKQHPVFDAVQTVFPIQRKIDAYNKLKEISNDPRVVAQALNVWSAVKAGNRVHCAPQSFEVYDAILAWQADQNQE
jgi:hypothetical protein